MGTSLELLFGLLLLKYFKIVLISFWNFVEMGGGIRSICVKLGLLTSLLFLPIASWIFGVNLAEIFLLSELNCLSALKEFQLALWTKEIRFYMVLPIPLRSLSSFDSKELICLLDMYLAIKLRKFLMFLASKAKCLIDP